MTRHMAMDTDKVAIGTGVGDEPRARRVGRIVCGYEAGALPGEWLQTWRRLDRLIARSGYKIKVGLAPLNGLPVDTDILVVPPALRDAARAAAPPGTPLLVTPASSAGAAFEDLIARLKAGREVYADPVEEIVPGAPKIVSYIGQTRVD